jgi:hypothetical protein
MTDAELEQLLATPGPQNQYEKQLKRVKDEGKDTQYIETAVSGVLSKMPEASKGSLVIYGEPQSGKTEMMICLTAKLLDAGHHTIVHLLNDSVDLLGQNLTRFMLAGLAPAPRNASDLANSPLVPNQNAILFCKKNAKDLTKLIEQLKAAGPVVVIDDEADYATPNAKINQHEKTRINDLVSQLLGEKGIYIGVTATPARLNLNNTFDNKPEHWVHFPSHAAYTGQDVFFPITTSPSYQLNLLPGAGSPEEAQIALARFLVTVAYLNTTALDSGGREENYSFLVHTSGKTDDHTTDRKIIEDAMNALIGKTGKYKDFVNLIIDEARALYPDADAIKIAMYVIENASRSSFVVLNSKRDRSSAGDKATVPTCPFTVIIGGNIVSRGVTFDNLLSMFFTRDVKTKLQQDTYIQRARMFGSRSKYLKHFQLTIPAQLYDDWHRCFVFHRLALQTIENSDASPVWIGDPRISIASSSSIDRGTVNFTAGEMAFQMFDCPNLQALDNLIESAPTDMETLKRLSDETGGAVPDHLIDYLHSALSLTPGTLAIHTSKSIEGYGPSADHENISRKKGFIGKNQIESGKFPNAVHHVNIFHNGKGKARVFYKNVGGGVHFVKNEKAG